MRLFGSQKISGIMTRLGMKEGEVMEHRWLNKSVETAQRRVEQQNFAIRKRTLEFDDVMNKQRSIVYELRGKILTGSPEEVHGTILEVFDDLILTKCEGCFTSEKDSDPKMFLEWLNVTFPVMVTEEELKPFFGKPADAAGFVSEKVHAAYESKCAAEDQAVLPSMERGVFLQCIDRHWQDYLRAMDDLRHNVNLRTYGQRDPLIEYKREAFEMFEQLISQIKSTVANSEFRCTTAANMRRMIAAAQAARQRAQMSGPGDPSGSPEASQASEPSRPKAVPPEKREENNATVADLFASMMSEVSGRQVKAVRMPPQNAGQPAPAGAVGRNDPCPCGSGKKYKKCCGRGLV